MKFPATLFLPALAGLFSQKLAGQDLLVKPSFECYVDGKPVGWTTIAGSPDLYPNQ